MNFWHFKKPIHIITETELTKLTLQRPIFSHIVTFANGDGIVVVETDDVVVIVDEVVEIVDEVVVLLDVGIAVEFVEGVVVGCVKLPKVWKFMLWPPNPIHFDPRTSPNEK